MAQAKGKKGVAEFDPAVRARYEEAAKEYKRAIELLDGLRRAGIDRPGYRLALPHHHDPRRRRQQPAAARGLDPNTRG